MTFVSQVVHNGPLKRWRGSSLLFHQIAQDAKDAKIEKS
jgi:hypothetical protein